MKKNISLIGMSGAGKTSTARELVLLLNDFVMLDTDKFIVEKEKLSISEIFEKYGENYFRKLEADVINEVFKGRNQVISLGGGAFENSENRRVIKENSTVIYLKTSADVLFERLKDSNDRPLLNVGDTRAKIEEILGKRDENYKKSDIIIETDNKSPRSVALEIIEVLNNEL